MSYIMNFELFLFKAHPRASIKIMLSQSRAPAQHFSRTLSVVDSIVRDFRQTLYCKACRQASLPGPVSSLDDSKQTRVDSIKRRWSQAISVRYVVRPQLVEHQERQDHKSQSWLSRAGALLSAALLLCGTDQNRMSVISEIAS